jgi:hypothetical protein
MDSVSDMAMGSAQPQRVGGAQSSLLSESEIGLAITYCPGVNVPLGYRPQNADAQVYADKAERERAARERAAMNGVADDCVVKRDASRWNTLVNAFCAQESWRAFEKLRPKEIDEYPFLDGIRLEHDMGHSWACLLLC